MVVKRRDYVLSAREMGNLEKHLKHILVISLASVLLICRLQKSFCGISTMKWNLRTHTYEKRYQCTVCKKSFSRMDYLKQHLRTHTGETPH